MYGGELKAMGFKAELYQHDPHLRAVLTAPWTMVPVMNEPTEADSKSKSTSSWPLLAEVEVEEQEVPRLIRRPRVAPPDLHVPVQYHGTGNYVARWPDAADFHAHRAYQYRR